MSSPNANSEKQPSATVVFSDIDGTLVHYPKDFNSYASVISTDTETGTVIIEYKQTREQRICVPLPSKTGGTSYISQKTHHLITKLRSLPNTTFVIITGARASTYTSRRPKLPNADYEFFENGGRKLCNGLLDHKWSDQFHQFVGEIPHVPQLSPSGMAEPNKRVGKLWDVYRILEEQGWKLDARDYTTNLRVDVKNSEGKTGDDFENVVRDLVKIQGLDSSFNLGKADIYPKGSGKGNAARHVLDLLNVKAEDAVALFDDDNDIDLGILCGASYLPGVTHETVLNAMKGRPWTVMDRKGFLGTEDALETVIELRQRALAEGAEQL